MDVPSYMGSPSLSPGYSIPIQLPANAHLGDTAGGRSSTWVPDTPMEGLDEIPVSGLQPGAALSVLGII